MMARAAARFFMRHAHACIWSTRGSDFDAFAAPVRDAGLGRADVVAHCRFAFGRSATGRVGMAGRYVVVDECF